MARVHLHPIPSPKRAAEVASLLVRLYGAGRRVVVWVGDAGRMAILDDFLWSFDRLSFLPHAIASGSETDADEPVVLVSEPANPGRADVLVVADGLPPPHWVAGFAEVHDLLPPGRDGEERRMFWDQWRDDLSGVAP